MYDKFPSNIAETSGRIEKKSFVFQYDFIEIWQGGECVFEKNYNGLIKAKVLNDEMHMNIDNREIQSYIKDSFYFKEISTNLDRVMWSKDIFNLNGGISEKNNPDVSSLFFKDNELVKIAFTIHNPSLLIEFGVKEPKQINQKLKNLSHLKNLLAVAAADGHIDTNEEELIYKISSKYNISYEELESIFLNPEKIDLIIPTDKDEKFNQLKELVYVMISDGEISTEEYKLCEIFADKLGFDSSIIQKIIDFIINR
jgi:tellurite resistance protein